MEKKMEKKMKKIGFFFCVCVFGFFEEYFVLMTKTSKTNNSGKKKILKKLPVSLQYSMVLPQIKTKKIWHELSTESTKLMKDKNSENLSYCNLLIRRNNNIVSKLN